MEDHGHHIIEAIDAGNGKMFLTIKSRYAEDVSYQTDTAFAVRNELGYQIMDAMAALGRDRVTIEDTTGYFLYS